MAKATTAQEQSTSPFVNFGQAIEAAKEGATIARQFWAEGNVVSVIKGQVDEEDHSNGFINGISDELYTKSQKTEAELGRKIIPTVAPNLIISTSNGVSAWAPSVEDVLAGDWTIVS